MERDCRTYTRKQIEEALKYWTKRLDVLNESITRTIQALIDEFGEKRVISCEKDYRLTKEDLQKIYDVLNRCLFDGKLGRIRLEYWPEAMVVDKLQQNHIESEDYGEMVDSALCYGVFSGVAKDIKNAKGEIVDVDVSKEIIMINKTYLKDCVFMFAVASICHEMIHYADRYTDEFHDKMVRSSQTGMSYNPHENQLFIDKMAEANAEGVNVIANVSSGETYDDLNRRAYYTMKRVLDEDDDNKSIVAKDDQTLIVRGPGSNKTFFAFFD